jgi:hypothetical protein
MISDSKHQVAEQLLQIADVLYAADHKLQCHAGPRDDVSVVSAFTADGSPPHNLHMPSDGISATPSRSGDMYDAVTAASMAARYAAEHVMKLGGSAGMLAGKKVQLACNRPPKPASGTLLHNGRWTAHDHFAASYTHCADRPQVPAACRHSQQSHHRGVRGVATPAATVRLPLSSHQRAASQQRPCCSVSATTRGKALCAHSRPAAAASHPCALCRDNQWTMDIAHPPIGKQLVSSLVCTCSMVDLNSVTDLLASTTDRMVQRQQLLQLQQQRQQAAASFTSSVPSPSSSTSPPAPKGAGSSIIKVAAFDTNIHRQVPELAINGVSGPHAHLTGYSLLRSVWL